MYCGHVDYLITYRQFSDPTETYVETKKFQDYNDLSALLDSNYLELMREIYGADDVEVTQVFVNDEIHPITYTG